MVLALRGVGLSLYTKMRLAETNICAARAFTKPLTRAVGMVAENPTTGPGSRPGPPQLTAAASVAGHANLLQGTRSE